MGLHRSLIFVLLGAFLSSCFLKGECRYLEGYKFPVYTTEFCPRNQSEWNERSSSIYCNDSIGYMCMPNENITKLIEFCFPAPFTWIEEGVCLVLHKHNSKFLPYKCSKFWSGCPSASYTSDKSFEHPNCTAIGIGCFLAETTCSSTTPSHLRITTEQLQSENITTLEREQDVTKYLRKSTENTYGENNRLFIFIPIPVGILAPICVFLALSIYFGRRNPNRKERDIEIHSEEEINPLIQQEQQIDTRDSPGIPCEKKCEIKIHSEEEINPPIQQEQNMDTRNTSGIPSEKKCEIKIHSEEEINTPIQQEQNMDTRDSSGNPSRQERDIEIHTEEEINPFIQQEQQIDTGDSPGIPSEKKCEIKIHSEEEINTPIQQEQNMDTRDSSGNKFEARLKTEVSSKKENEQVFLETELDFLLHTLKKPHKSWTPETLIKCVKKMIATLFDKKKIDLLKRFCIQIKEDGDIRNTLLACGEEMYQVRASITEKYNAMELNITEGCVCLTFCFDAERDVERFLYILRTGEAELKRDISKLILNKTLMDIFGIDLKHVSWAISTVTVKKGSTFVKEEMFGKLLVGSAEDFVTMEGSTLVTNNNNRTAVRVCKSKKCCRDAEFYCFTCELEMCLSCMEDHVNDFYEKEHQVEICRAKINLSTIDEYCAMHSKLYRMYCKECKVPTCPTCIHPEDHSDNDITESYQVKRKQVIRTVITIRTDALFYRKALLAGIIPDFKTSQNQFKIYQSEMLTKAQTLKNFINKVEKDFMHNVYCDFDFKHRCLKQKKEMIRHIVSLQEYELGYVQPEFTFSALQFLSFIKTALPQIHLTLHTSQLSMTESLNEEDVMESLSTIQITVRGTRQLAKDQLLTLMPAPKICKRVEITDITR